MAMFNQLKGDEVFECLRCKHQWRDAQYEPAKCPNCNSQWQGMRITPKVAEVQDAIDAALNAE